MSAASLALAALFALGMIGLSLALFMKGARERTKIQNPPPTWARPRGLG
jgi:hypothetical protein